MSKKQTSDESSKNSAVMFQKIDNAKRGRLASMSDITLHDLPVEMLQLILIESVAMEVDEMKMAKCVWKEKAELVISRLRAVCSNWNSVLTSEFFRKELHRTLDRIAQKTIHLEILHQSTVDNYVFKVTTLKDKVLVMGTQFHRNKVLPVVYTRNITVYDRDNMTEVKDVIVLPGITPRDIAACNMSDSVYVLEHSIELRCCSVSRFTMNKKQQFSVQSWISDLRLSASSMSVSMNGNLIIFSMLRTEDSHGVSVYHPNGFLQREILLSSDIREFRYVENVIAKSNGNLVLASVIQNAETALTELSAGGIIERQHKTSLYGRAGVNFADSFGRIAIYDPEYGVKLLDSEFNVLDFNGPQFDLYDANSYTWLHYNRERIEAIGSYNVDLYSSVLTIFRFSKD